MDIEQQVKQFFDKTQSTTASGQRTNPMNTIDAQQFIFSDDGTCNYCNGIINNQG